MIDALEEEKPAAGLVHHSDRGTQNTALSLGKKLEEAGIVPSMGRVVGRAALPSQSAPQSARKSLLSGVLGVTFVTPLPSAFIT
jgi:hypothetical protein